MKYNNLALRIEREILDHPRRALWLSLGILGALTTVFARRQGVARNEESIR